MPLCFCVVSACDCITLLAISTRDAAPICVRAGDPCVSSCDNSIWDDETIGLTNTSISADLLWTPSR